MVFILQGDKIVEKVVNNRRNHFQMYYCFFFQAEDGIRDGHVTGVQTCALPICLQKRRSSTAMKPALRCSGILSKGTTRRRRSEERRVGKECRSWGKTYHAKDKK